MSKRWRRACERTDVMFDPTSKDSLWLARPYIPLFEGISWDSAQRVRQRFDACTIQGISHREVFEKTSSFIAIYSEIQKRYRCHMSSSASRLWATREIFESNRNAGYWRGTTPGIVLSFSTLLFACHVASPYHDLPFYILSAVHRPIALKLSCSFYHSYHLFYHQVILIGRSPGKHSAAKRTESERDRYISDVDVTLAS